MSPSISDSEVKKIPLDNFDPEPSTIGINAGPSDAEKPFDVSAKADVILRSSDSVDFFALKAILCVASPVFDHMFSITQKSNVGESKNETKNGLPVVDLAEDSTTLYNLLPLLYPYAKDPTNTLEVLTRVAETAQKYAMDETLQKLKKLIMSCSAMLEESMETFAVALHFGWVEMVREAALNTLAIPIRDLVSGDKQSKSKFLHFIDVLDKLFASWTTTYTNVPHIITRRIFGPHLSKRLKETGCPRSTVLMDDHFVSSETIMSVFGTYGYNLEKYNSDRGSMMKDIDNALSKVPLTINGIVVQTGD